MLEKVYISEGDLVLRYHSLTNYAYNWLKRAVLREFWRGIIPKGLWYLVVSLHFLARKALLTYTSRLHLKMNYHYVWLFKLTVVA